MGVLIRRLEGRRDEVPRGGEDDVDGDDGVQNGASIAARARDTLTLVEYTVVAKPEPELLDDVASLHHGALSYRSFITDFGPRFLTVLYRGLLSRGDGFLLVATEDGSLVGFILACTDSTRLLSAVLGSPFEVASIILPALVRSPRRLTKLIQTLRYGSRRRVPIPAELLVIAVVPERRSTGVGRRLLTELRAEFRARGIDAYKVTVHEQMADANHFYSENGLHMAGQFRLYGVPWNLYVDRLT